MQVPSFIIFLKTIDLVVFFKIPGEIVMKNYISVAGLLIWGKQKSG